MPTTHPHELNIIRGIGEDFHLFHDMLGDCAEMQDVFDKVKRVAACEASVLIRGETGTGKELVAKALHTRSSRAKGPFLAINCATLTPELLASELFGHVRGAFTGAIKDKKGLFELAHQGTLFLDEIAELPLLLQARLLRVIQEQQFIPVGGTEPIKVDVRLLSATHRALRAEVNHGRFRADLMYRLRVIPLYLPPLRQRGSDILLVTRFLIHTLNVRLAPLKPRATKGLSPEAELAIKTYPWPGNIRELSNALEYALIMGRSQYIEFEDLPPELKGVGPIESTKSRADENSIERGTVLRALSINNGHREEAAKDLGISRATLWRKMKHLGLLKENKVKPTTDQS
jgi:two-component system, NtrC family, response regulator AtoC